jgi:hypothetical protein
MKKKQNNNEDYKKVLSAISEYVFEKHLVCGIDEIMFIAGFSRTRCAEILSTLKAQKQIYEIFSGNGKPTLYLPYDMMQDLLRLQHKPSWIVKYRFPKVTEVEQEIGKLKKTIFEYETFERLLYATDKPLEEAIAQALSFLEFDQVKHTDDSESHDVEFTDKGKIYLIEVKGKGNAADKGDVTQLYGWIDKKLDQGTNADDLQGILAVNHYRHVDPAQRQGPFTEKAVQFLKQRRLLYLSTPFLFDILKKVMNSEITKENARKLVVEGEKYD